MLLAVDRSDGDGQYLLHDPFFFETQRFFEGDLVEGVDAHLDAVRDDTGTIRLDPDADVVIDDALDRYENAFHLGLGGLEAPSLQP